MIQEYVIATDKRNREIFPADTDALPFYCHHARLDRDDGSLFPWHWHNQFEIDYIDSGETDFLYPDNCIHLHKGDAVFINSGVLHAYRAEQKNRPCTDYALLFDASLLGGLPGGLLEQNYIYPVSHCRALPALVFHPDCPDDVNMISQILTMLSICREEPDYYEFSLRNHLSNFWCSLMKRTEALRSASASLAQLDIPRLKSMISYIEGHYSERITLSSIAAAANISAREATRCFSRSLGTSPVSFLNEHRLRTACGMLSGTTMGVLEISIACGFSSASYFSSQFRASYGCTPLEYRRKSES